jgi:hypothetical protein
MKLRLAIIGVALVAAAGVFLAGSSALVHAAQVLDPPVSPRRSGD